MTEGLFILTSVFIAYIVYVIVNEPKKSAPETPKVQPEFKAEDSISALEKAAVVIEPVTAVATTPKEVVIKTPTPATVEPVPTLEIPEKTIEASAPKAGLKNPKTGEVVTTYNNYRFLKRWIKEALVSEGLLSKIYKNNELNAEAEAKIKVAMAKLEDIDKYRA